MRLALIPPLAALAQTKRTDYQLMLPHLLNDINYARCYNNLCNDPNQFVILDNGIAEGVNVDWEQYCHFTYMYGVDEFVLPDVMGDMEGTIRATAQFLNEHRHDVPVGIGKMFVAQGQNFAECCRAITWAAAHSEITTIGIPRHLLQTTGDMLIRLRLVKYMERVNQEYLFNHLPLNIHLLGASPLWCFEAAVAGAFLGGKIRGMDTSMPFVYAMHASEVDDPRSTPWLRPDNYFDGPTCHAGVMEHNVATMIRWANGDT